MKLNIPPELTTNDVVPITAINNAPNENSLVVLSFLFCLNRTCVPFLVDCFGFFDASDVNLIPAETPLSKF